MTSRDATIEQVIDKLKDKREEIAGLLEQNEAALVYVKYGSSDLGTEQRPEVYFKVEKTYSRSYLTTGYILRFSVMSPGFENALEPSIAWVFEDGTYHIWKKEDGVTYPHLGTYSSDNGGEKNLDELKATFETLTKTLFNKIPENSTGIFDLNVGGIGVLIVKAENVIRQMGTSWERGMYYTIMGGTGGYFDFEDYMGLVWVGVGGGTGGNANAVIWKKNNKMIYPKLDPISWNDYGNPDIQTLADFLNYNFPIIEGGIDEKGVALLTILSFKGSRPLLCKVEKSLQWIGTADALGGLYITPLYVDLLGQTPCVIFISAGLSVPVIWKKEETSQADSITLAMNIAAQLTGPELGDAVLAGTNEEISQMFLSLKENPQTSIIITDGNTRITPMLQEFKDSGDAYYLDLIFIAQSNDYKILDEGDLEFTQKLLYKCYMKIKYEVSTKNSTVNILNTIEIS